jgi:hypothetical protein
MHLNELKRMHLNNIDQSTNLDTQVGEHVYTTIDFSIKLLRELISKNSWEEVHKKLAELKTIIGEN